MDAITISKKLGMTIPKVLDSILDHAYKIGDKDIIAKFDDAGTWKN